MIWALLALLGIPLWFIAAVLIGVFRNRKVVRGSPEVFKFFERTDKGWSRRAGYARWVSDVVIFHKGLGLIRSDAIQVLDVAIHDQVDDPPKKLGESAVEVVLTLADSDSRRVSTIRPETTISMWPTRVSLWNQTPSASAHRVRTTVPTSRASRVSPLG